VACWPAARTRVVADVRYLALTLSTPYCPHESGG
jgi:hypothetical protein